MFCMHCGKLLPDDSIYCSFCGKALPKTSTTSIKPQLPSKASILMDKLVYPVIAISFVSFYVLLYTIYSHAPHNGNLSTMAFYGGLAIIFLLIVFLLMAIMQSCNKNTSKRIKYCKVLFCLSILVSIPSITLCSIHAIKRTSIIDSVPAFGTAHVKASIDAEFYTTLSEGYVNNPFYYLVINDTTIHDDTVFEVSLGQKYSTEVHCSYRGSSNKSSGNGSTSTQIIFSQSQLQNHKSTTAKVHLNSHDTAVVTAVFEWAPTFWDVLFF